MLHKKHGYTVIKKSKNMCAKTLKGNTTTEYF